MKLTDDARRGLIFAYFDPDGRLDAINATYLRALVETVDVAVVVVNGACTDASAKAIEDLGAALIRRPNTGYDIWAFKAGVDALADQLGSLDELIIANSSVFGPLRPLDQMIRTMAQRDVDFWGITRHAAIGNSRGAHRERAHIQSYFTAFRSPMLRSAAFTNYWRDLPVITGYADAVQAHEMVMTGRFEDQGFRWDTYIDTSDLEQFAENPIIGCASELIHRGSPVFKRRLLNLDTDALLSHSDGTVVADLWAILRKHPLVDMAALEEHVVRTMDMQTVANAVQDNVAIDEGPEHPIDGLTVVVEPGPMAERRLQTMLGAFDSSSIVLLKSKLSSSAPQTQPLQRFHQLATDDALVAAANVSGPLCYLMLEAGATRGTQDARIADDHRRHTLGDHAIEFRRIAAAFDQSAALGAVIAPPNLARTFFGRHGGRPNPRQADALHKAQAALGLTSPLPPTMPGTGAWLRVEALREWPTAREKVLAALSDAQQRQLASHDWLAILLAWLPRNGWWWKHASSRRTDSAQRALSHTMIGRLNAAIGTTDGEPFDAAIQRVDATQRVATMYFDVGSGFTHHRARQVTADPDDFVVECTVPSGVHGIRFDPDEGAGLLVEDLVVEPSTYRIAPLNGTRSGTVDFFPTQDPAYLIVGPCNAGDELVIRARRVERLAGSSQALALLERRFSRGGPVALARQLAVRSISKAGRMIRARRQH